MARSFHSVTFGCKLNQFDTTAIEGELCRRGWSATDDATAARLVLVNTCTVTHRADADARRKLRSLRRHNPDCTLLVTGCYAEADAESLRAVDGVDRVFGNRDKSRIAEILDELGIVAPPSGDRGCDGDEIELAGLGFSERARAFLKVQEGCRLACSYCIIPQVRGPSRSIEPQRVISSASELRQAGFREIVLTGVNTGDYGLDLTPRTRLAELLRKLLEALPDVRIRLNSLEPLTVSDEIIELLASQPRLAPHLQIPLQSGSASVLRRMRRNYRLEHYADLLAQLRNAVPQIGLGADVIVGFPGETDAEFEETRQFIAGSPLNYLHVFSWSPRSGTDAADLPQRVASQRVSERSRVLRGLGEELGLRFRRRFVGRTLDAVVLDPPKDNGARRALTGNFIDLELRGSNATRGSFVEVRLERADAARTEAVQVGRPVWSGAETTAPPRRSTATPEYL